MDRRSLLAVPLILAAGALGLRTLDWQDNEGIANDSVVQKAPRPKTEVNEKGKKDAEWIQRILSEPSGSIPCEFEAEALGEMEGGGPERQDREREWRECLQDLSKEEQALARVKLSEIKAKRQNEQACLGHTEDCEEEAEAFTQLMDEAGVTGWTWSEETKVLPNRDGAPFVMIPGYQLDLFSEEDLEVLELETIWNGSDVAISGTVYHEHNGSWYRDNMEISGDQIGQDTTMTTYDSILKKWEKSQKEQESEQ